ncbi:hypothetical protein [Streptomyces sp. NPDC047070]|uniref:hypothetical protein n=1 Tax=Streptomyces sp. NPDC047070 TaxID=3154923 RepID=UPI00345699AE
MCDPPEEDNNDQPFFADVHSRTYDCPRCERGDTVLEATFCVTTKDGVHPVGVFAYCFGCESVLTNQEASRV